jgi:hypothetical protein
VNFVPANRFGFFPEFRKKPGSREFAAQETGKPFPVNIFKLKKIPNPLRPLQPFRLGTRFQ